MLRVDPLPRPGPPGLALGRSLGLPGAEARSAPTNVFAEEDPELSGLACVHRRPKEMAFGAWISEVLVRRQGVLAALPPSVWPPSATESQSAMGRIVALDPGRAAGRSWWWLWHLKRSEYVQSSAYSADSLTRVYHTDGLEAAANQWLPKASDCDALVLSAGFDLVTLAGFAVAVRMVPPPVLSGSDGGGFDRVPALQQRLLLDLEAGAMATGPAVLGTMLVHEHGGYMGYEKLDAHADAELLREEPPESLGRVVASVTVTQTHSFRLGDLLASYNQCLGDSLRRPTLPGIAGGLHEATAGIARKVRMLADQRILKLNMTPDTVVFCPRLVEDAESGELAPQGFSCEGRVPGTPFIWDFDPVHTKRVSAQSGDYDADCAYSVMMLVLLATARAQYGEAASRVMVNKLIGRSVEGAELPPDERPDDFDRIDLMATGRRSNALMREARESGRSSDFCTLLRSALPVFAKEHEATLGAAHAELARDFAEIVRSEVMSRWGAGEPEGFDPARPVFGMLVRYLSRSAQADSALFARPSASAQAEALLDRESAQRLEQRLEAVRLARAERRR